VRVLEVVGRSAGGPARHVADIVAAFDGRGGLSLDVAGTADWPVVMPKPAFRVPIPDGARHHSEAVAALRALVRRGGYQLVHAHGLRAGIDAGAALVGTGVPLLATVHNVLRPDIAGRARYTLLRWSEPLLLGLAQRVLTPSAEIARTLAARPPRAARKLEVVYLGVEPAGPTRPAGEVRRELEVAGSGALMVTAARLAPQKALHVMLAALARLPDGVVLAILGEGPLEDDLRSLAARLGIAPRVRWLHWRNDVSDLIAAADVFCLSSTWEACALAAQEAMHLGTVVVSTDVGGMPELVIDGVGGLLVPAGDDAALARALARVIDSPDERARLVEGARRHVAARFSRRVMLDRMARAYRETAVAA